MEEKRFTGTVTRMSNKPLPTIIQGGMGAGVSSWSLARAVSNAGQLGNAAVEIIGRADVELARSVFEDERPELRFAACQTPRELDSPACRDRLRSHTISQEEPKE